MSNDIATVLVVDDTPENIDVLRGLLKPYYKVKVAINGEQALKLSESETPPDLVLLDVMMPGMDGYEVCRRLKSNPQTEGIPVIFVTAMNETHDEVLGFEVGGVDYINKPVTPAIVLARVKTQLKLRAAYHFIRDTFGRYLSEEIVDNLIDSPHGLQLGGEKRMVTILMADLRGFTSIGERLPAESVVDMINIFLSAMTDVIQKYQGTIDEFIGDAILAIFGAPVQREDDAIRAVRCAIEMQLAMEEVNASYAAAGYPRVEMGIGINTGEVIVGNIGSQKRSKYAVVGRHVNTTSRIESYTVGGQILVSESTRDACEGLLQVNDEMRVMPKGISEEISIFDVGGVSGDEPVMLAGKTVSQFRAFAEPVRIRMLELKGTQAKVSYQGEVLRMSERVMEVRSDHAFDNFSNLRVTLVTDSGPQNESQFYAKVISRVSDEPVIIRMHATYLPVEVQTVMEGCI
ncbi:adenylate cyclase [Mariprofundus micogutta]|uniref:Adenylate cyclase n=1 Tax=Mariprofundus micogutta TaxID=1921010 RepID=A0A1L8CK41_9PROT|nr:adenylate/guanylate cyclase domain-containing protein [Mariprofundus micogutta]GAV19277.1 adenylate cyclase [Mariprofundus micogutta]